MCRQVSGLNEQVDARCGPPFCLRVRRKKSFPPTVLPTVSLGIIHFRVTAKMDLYRCAERGVGGGTCGCTYSRELRVSTRVPRLENKKLSVLVDYFQVAFSLYARFSLYPIRKEQEIHTNVERDALMGWGLGFRVEGLWFVVYGVWFMVEGLRGNAYVRERLFSNAGMRRARPTVRTSQLRISKCVMHL